MYYVLSALRSPVAWGFEMVCTICSDMLYVPVNNFSAMSGHFTGLSITKQWWIQPWVQHNPSGEASVIYLAIFTAL